tara:strand:+ start:100 stop:336 length:237 start_codon:yes stop_codon:yes gene_type:complete
MVMEDIWMQILVTLVNGAMDFLMDLERSQFMHMLLTEEFLIIVCQLQRLIRQISTQLVAHQWKVSLVVNIHLFGRRVF